MHNIWKQFAKNHLGTVLCAYYVCKNIHGLVGPPKGWTDWEEEVSKKLVNIRTRILISRNKLSPFSIG